ncbi:MAG: CDP-glycerol glycerophosphotransferase family protein [Clostridiales bacterium]|nr:CDP-glycerol glycerophosphotransferase family protein [Clostridiales bacterium]
MIKFNYRLTANINENIMQIRFRCKLPDEMRGRKIRVQAVFSQRQIDRRFPMEVTVEEQEAGPQILADADVELAYVFRQPPRRKVTVTFALWCGTKEWILDDQPFPVQRELFARTEEMGKKNILKFIGCTIALPFLLVKDYMQEDKNRNVATKKANETVYRVSGYSYSPRQRKTDYFASKYDKYAKKISVKGNTVLFLSERLPEEGGNLQLVKQQMEKDPDLVVTEFINTRTVDALKRKELRECARKCAEASVIVLEDFYPQLHRLNLRRETKVVQLWHACGAFKTFGLTRMGKQGGAPQSSMNHRNYDFVSVSSEAMCGIYAEAFAVPTRKVKALGVPRTDGLFDWEAKKKKREYLYAAYPALRDQKIVLFAPTFRGDGNKDSYYPEDTFDVNAFMEKMPEDVTLIVKHHPFVHQTFSVAPQWEERVLDLTGKDHINDLLLITDLLITDYSSSIFEAALLGTPMLFYAFDLKEYMESRDFYFAYEEMVPGPIEYTFAGMTRKAAKMVSGRWSPENDTDPVSRGTRGKVPFQLSVSTRMEQFGDAFLSSLDGHSTERITGYIKQNFLDVGQTNSEQQGEEE